MKLLAPLAVYFNFDWPEAHRFVGYKFLRKLKLLRLQSEINHPLVESIESKIVDCFEKYIAHKPDLARVKDWIDANARLSVVHLNMSQLECISKCIAAGRRVTEFRREIGKKYQLDELGIEFIPRTLAVGSLGVYEELEGYIKASALGIVPKRKLILLLDPKSSVNNPCYLNYWSRYVTVISDPKLIEMLTPLENCLTTPLRSPFTSYNKKTLLTHIALGMVREKWIKEKRSPLLILLKEDEERGWKCLKSLEVPEGAWFVCLHVREPGWCDEYSAGEKFRNADINTYLPVIKSITAAGGWVIRLGDSISMTPLKPMANVIDYAHSSLKSDWMDIFLCSQCRFLIGTASGVYTVSQAFSVPTVMTNYMSAHSMYAITSQDIFLPKLCVSKADGRRLTFQELVSPPVGIAVNSYEDLGIEVLDNTPEEIKGAVNEMLARFDGTLQYTQEDEYLQNEFKSVVKNCAELYGDKEIELYARMGRDFLRKHASLLSVEEAQC